jgi:polyhydroxybutyrate depolymerase
MCAGPSSRSAALLPLAAALALGGAACGGGGAPAGPEAAGCITDVSPGRHTFTCEGLVTDVQVPAACARPGCGLILELHGDTGTGPLFDANTNLMALGDARGYIVVAPTGPPLYSVDPAAGSTWRPENDDQLIAIVQDFAAVFRSDPRRTHVTGFSRGGYVTWRLLCTHADLFASVAPAASGADRGGSCDGVSEVSCPFDPAQPGGMPSRPRSVLFLAGRQDTAVPFACATLIRDQAVAAWSLAGPTVVDGDDMYTHARWASAGATLETFEHDYTIPADGTEAAFGGHCIPGSTVDPQAPQYAVACAAPTAFVWGEAVMGFFAAHAADPP